MQTELMYLRCKENFEKIKESEEKSENINANTECFKPNYDNPSEFLENTSNATVMQELIVSGVKCTNEWQLPDNIIFKSNDKKPYHCMICNYKTVKQSLIAQHVQTHKEKHPKRQLRRRDKTVRQSLDVDNLLYSSDEEKNSKEISQRQRSQKKEKKFACNLCDYKCADQSNFAKHKRRHTGEKPYSCTFCNYKCNDSSSLAIHTTKHTGEKPFVCPICDYKTRLKVNLKSHMRTHTGEKPFTCSSCDFKFTRKTSLVRHEVIHTGERPYACTYCDYKSRHKSGLSMHVTKHTGEKPYACHVCDYRSRLKVGLTIHTRTHTGEKPFVCTACDYKCADRGSLVRHKRKNHVHPGTGIPDGDKNV